jgi:alpha-methylacyl-CoA racemase
MSTATPLPLAGIKIIELHAIGPVPYAGQLLRRLGADIERISPPSDPGLGVSSREEFDLLNAGKTRTLLDLKSAAGQQALMARLEQADVLLEGFRPGVLERLGLAPAQLLARFPRLVIGRLSGWGVKGPYAERAGHDINYLALTGLLHAIGPAHSPVPPLNVVGDFGGGAMHLLLGVMAKLIERGRTGRGGTVQTSILAGSVGLSYMFYGMLAAGTWQVGREINILDGATPYYRVYKTRDGRFLSAGAIEPKFYREMIDVLGLTGQIDPAQQNVRETWPATIERFAQAVASRTRDEWAQACITRDCCLAPVLDFHEAAAEAHNLDNGLYVPNPFPQVGTTIEFDVESR